MKFIPNINIVLKNREHLFWVILQQFFSRGLIAVKFLLIARILGPESVGLISVALVSLAFIEALTDLGLMQAIISRKNELLIEQENSIWTLQFMRGIGITIFLIAMSSPIEALFNIQGTKEIVSFVALASFFKNSISIGLFKKQREKNFRIVSILQLIGVVTDLVITLILIVIFNSAFAAIAGLIIAEFVKAILSHILFKTKIKLAFDFTSIKDVTNYGRWIWANSISTLLFSQLDKILASRYLGASVLGLYQMSQKFTQMGIYDISFALGQYFFPVFSKIKRDNPGKMQVVFTQFYCLTFYISAFMFGYLYINSENFILLILGEEWKRMDGIFKLMLFSSFFAAIINVCIGYLRAIGKPNLVTISSYIQLILVVPFSIVGVKLYGAEGLVYASIVGFISTNLILTTLSIKSLPGAMYKFIPAIILSLFLTGIFALINFYLTGIWLLAVSSFYFVILILFTLMKYKRIFRFI